MPPKKKTIKYPRYFQGSEDKTAIIVFPAAGSMGTAYFTDLKCWSLQPNWTLAEMANPPEDIEIVRWQAVALGVPANKLPKFKAEPKSE